MAKMRGGLRAVLAAVLVVSLLSPTSAAASTGWLDPTFSQDGLVYLPTVVDYGPVGVEALAVRVGPTGRVFVGRELRSDESEEMNVLALGSHGAIASGFNAGAWTTGLYADEAGDMIGLHPTADGGVVAALFDGWTAVLTVHRYGPGGGRSLTRTFDIDDDQHLAQSSLERLPGGSYRMCHQDGEDDITRLIGLTAALDPDVRVGPAGRHPLEIDGCWGIAADAAGHLYVANVKRVDDSVDSRLAIEILRTNTSGTTDAAWGDGGVVTVERGGLRLTIGDRFSGAFAGGPRREVAASPMVVLPDGSMLIVAGVSRMESPGRFSAAVIRLGAGGDLDSAFGSGGVRALAPTGGQSRILAMAVDAQGRPILSLAYRYADGSTRYWLARLTATGGFDATFGNGGLIRQSYPTMSIDLDEAGRILTYARTPSGTTVVARRTP